MRQPAAATTPAEHTHTHTHTHTRNQCSNRGGVVAAQVPVIQICVTYRTTATDKCVEESSIPVKAEEKNYVVLWIFTILFISCLYFIVTETAGGRVKAGLEHLPKTTPFRTLKKKNTQKKPLRIQNFYLYFNALIYEDMT